MKRLFDTSVLVAAMVEAHPAHVRSLHAFQRSLKDGQGWVGAHSVAELFAVLTRMPVSPRIGPDLAHRLIQDNIESSSLNLVALETSDYFAGLERMTEFGLAGGVIYDALILQSACKAQVDEIITLNEADFVRISSGLAIRIVAP
jgi:predicted nucleic acid-binding protein